MGKNIYTEGMCAFKNYYISNNSSYEFCQQWDKNRIVLQKYFVYK